LGKGTPGEGEDLQGHPPAAAVRPSGPLELFVIVDVIGVRLASAVRQYGCAFGESDFGTGRVSDKVRRRGCCANPGMGKRPLLWIRRVSELIGEGISLPEQVDFFT
jgi:hypothetical protein